MTVPNLRPIDFRALRELIPIRRVLESLGWRERTREGSYLRGRCPKHSSLASQSRIFAVSLDRAWCFRCGWEGDVVALWGWLHGLRPLPAAHDLCRHMGLEPPFLH